MTADSYTAADIRILHDDDEIAALGPWAQAAAWSKRYPGQTTEFLNRLAESCELAGVPHELAERRYLVGDQAVEVPPELIEIHRELARAGRKG